MSFNITSAYPALSAKQAVSYSSQSPLAQHIMELNHTLREDLLAQPYMTYMIAPNEGRSLLGHLNKLEQLAFLTRALSRQSSRKPETLERSIQAIFDELIAMQKSLDLDQCPILTELLDSLYLAIEERTRDTLDVFIETLLDLRNTWSHAISVVAKAPI